MLKLMKGNIHNLQNVINSCAKNEISYEALSEIFAEKLLRSCEEKGMLPPRAKIPNLNASDNYWEPEES